MKVPIIRKSVCRLNSYFEEFDRIDTAFYREKQVQNWSRAKKEALMAGDERLLHEFAKCTNISKAENKDKI